MPEPTSRKRPGPRPRSDHELIRRYVRARADAGQLAATTVPNVRHVLHGFLALVGKPVGEVTRRDVEEWLGRPGLAASTRRHQLSIIRTFFGWAVEHGLVEANPTAGVARIRVPRSIPRGLKIDQVRRLLGVCPDARARLVVLLEVQCGLRSVEVSRLQLEHLDFAERTLFVETGKGGHQRLLPIPDEAWEALEQYLAEWPAATGPLIRSYPQANQPGGQALSSPFIVRAISSWMKEAGIPDAGHSLRHTFATDLVRRGVHLRDVQTALGHSSLANTSRYLPTNVADLRDAMAGRRYSNEPEETAAQALPAPTPALDAIGPLIDTVAALAAAVARLEARLDGRPAPKPPEEEITCPKCGANGPRSWMERFHLDGLHCADCGQPVDHGKLVRHRRREHAFTGCAWAWGEPHDHTATGHCLCPLCGQSSSGIVWGKETMASHHARPHERCPDCDRAYINLDAHRRRTHAWSR